MTMIAQIEVNTRCNHRCWYCQNAHYDRLPDKVMGLPLFEHILEEIARTYPKDELSIISFASYNEPTLDPHLKQRLRLLSDLGFAYWFISNGSGVSRELVDYIVREKIAIAGFHFNLPAIDPEAYHAAVAAPAENVFVIRDNLTYLLENRDRIGADIGIAVHGDLSEAHEHNYRQVKAFFEPYGVEAGYQGVMNRAGMLADVVNQWVDHQTEMLECAVEYFDNLYIGVEGNVYLCCHDYYQKYSYGSLQETPLEELVHSEQHESAIQGFKGEFCRHCPFARPLAAATIYVDREKTYVS